MVLRKVVPALLCDLVGLTAASEQQRALVITPPWLVAVLRAGWHPPVSLMHPSRPSHNRPVTAIVEIRTYKLKPGSGAAFHRAVVDESLPMLERWGVEVVAYGPSLDDEDSYYLIRAYPSLAERQQSQDEFYGSDEWRNGPREAIVSRIETDFSVVLPKSAL